MDGDEELLFVVPVADADDALAEPVDFATLTAFMVGLGTPRGFTLPLKFVELMPLMETHPRVSQ